MLPEATELAVQGEDALHSALEHQTSNVKPQTSLRRQQQLRIFASKFYLHFFHDLDDRKIHFLPYIVINVDRNCPREIFYLDDENILRDIGEHDTVSLDVIFTVQQQVVDIMYQLRYHMI